MLLRKDIEVVITALTRNQVCGNASWVRIPLFPPSLLYEKATTDKKHKLPAYLVLFCYYILCFCRWTKSLNLTAAFRRFFQKTGLELTTYRFCSIGYYNFIIIFKREQVFRFSLFCCCLSVVFQR